MDEVPIESFEIHEPGGLLAFETVRDHSLPIRASDLVRELMTASGLSPVEALHWDRFSRLFSAVVHHEYLAWMHTLGDLYSPLDPDRDTVLLEHGSIMHTENSDEAFLRPFESALRKANFSPMKLSAVEEAIRAPNELGLNYVPNIELFEHLRVYTRGRTQVRRTVRSFKTRFRRKTIWLDAFKRMIIVIKFRPNKDFGELARTDVLYLRMFKDVPFVDMEMHLPEQGTKVRMRGIDKAQIASPLIVGLPLFAFKLLTLSLISPMAIGGILVAPISAGLNSFFGFQRAKQKHMHRMIRNLYYLTLANNSSVIHWVVDAAEEEEFKEALLAYFFLWRHADDAQPWGLQELDRSVEEWLRAHTGHTIDFEAHDALNKLKRLGLLTDHAGEGLRAVPIEPALRRLDEQWDDLFRYNTGGDKPLQVTGGTRRN